MAKITIDGVEHEFEEGKNLFEACEEAKGKALPHFCYHPGLSIAGVCRMCQVEVEGSPKLQIACNSTVRDGMVVNTETQRVSETVTQILNFHLLHHPVDCPVCDQAGECSLQDQYMDHGLYDAGIDVEDKIDKGKVKPIGELVMLDAERCVLCARCTRFTAEVTKTEELGIFNRGNHAEIDVVPGQTLDNNYSLNTVDICPVGALTSRDFRFQKRVWWLDTTDSICGGCSTGCNMVASHEGGNAYRFQPRENLEVNRYWMCDEGRLSYKPLHENRLESCLVLNESGAHNEAGWDHAWNQILSRHDSLGAKADFVLVGSPHATVEELYALKSILPGAKILGADLEGSGRGAGDEILLEADRTPNRRGARLLGMQSFSAADLAAASGKNKTLIILNQDLAGLGDDARRALDGFGLVVSIGWQNNATAQAAHISLPSASFLEKEGIWINGKGRAQMLNRAFEPKGKGRDDLQILRELATLFGHEPSWSNRESLMAEMVSRESKLGALAVGIPATGLALDGAPADGEAAR